MSTSTYLPPPGSTTGLGLRLPARLDRRFTIYDDLAKPRRLNQVIGDGVRMRTRILLLHILELFVAKHIEECLVSKSDVPHHLHVLCLKFFQRLFRHHFLPSRHQAEYHIVEVNEQKAYFSIIHILS